MIVIIIIIPAQSNTLHITIYYYTKFIVGLNYLKQFSLSLSSFSSNYAKYFNFV